MGQMMHDEGAYSFVPYEVQDAYYSARCALERHHDGEGQFIAVAEDSDGQIIGFMIAAMVPYIFSFKARYASDLAVYVIPEKRGTSAAIRLVKAFEEWADTQNAAEKKLGVSTAINIERAHGFYTKLGYNQVGGLYTKRNGEAS